MKHYIIVKWNEKVTDKSLYYKRACDAFDDVTKIAGVTALKIYQSNSDRANRADLMIEIECTKDGLWAIFFMQNFSTNIWYNIC